MYKLVVFALASLLVFVMVSSSGSGENFGFSMHMIPVGESQNQSDLVHPDLNVELKPFLTRYAAEIGIGEPESRQYLLMDTGGGLVWTQCEPREGQHGEGCYDQNQPKYDRRKSKTFKKLEQSHPLCKMFKWDPATKQCRYDDVDYGKSGETHGFAATENFLLGPDNINLVFGCSSRNENFNSFKSSIISGILGLDLSPDSLATQLLPRRIRAFSHCFPSAHRDSQHILSFGTDIPPPPPSAKFQTTPFYRYTGRDTRRPLYWYFMNLEGLSVGSQKLPLSPDTFKDSFFIDSGASHTFLSSRVYPVVMSAFETFYLTKGLKKMKRGVSLEYCFLLPDGGFAEFPDLTFHFQGAPYVVKGNLVNIYFENNVFCVGLLKGEEYSILGANHMLDKRIIYERSADKEKGFIHFYDHKC